GRLLANHPAHAGTLNPASLAVPRPPDASLTLHQAPGPERANGHLPPPEPAAASAALRDAAPPGHELLEGIGRAGMAVGYRARQTQLGRIVALKMILAGAHATEADRARIRAEARAVARLSHPGVVQIFDVGEFREQPYLALEHCPGGTLAARLRGDPL